RSRLGNRSRPGLPKVRKPGEMRRRRPRPARPGTSIPRPPTTGGVARAGAAPVGAAPAPQTHVSATSTRDFPAWSWLDLLEFAGPAEGQGRDDSDDDEHDDRQRAGQPVVGPPAGDTGD